MKNNYKLIFPLLSLLYLLCFFTNSNDIRSLGIGVDIDDIDMRGYKDLTCLKNKNILSEWRDYRKCEMNQQKLYQISLEYDDRYAVTEEFEGTQVAGHPVLIYVSVDKNGIIEKINVKTDPKAPWYFRKQSYLLWLRIYNKYGSEGWKCLEKKPSDGHLLVGKKYINKICEKRFNEKIVILHTEFYFKNNKKDKENLVSRTNMRIEKNPSI